MKRLRLLPVMRPEHNMRDVIKQSALLEDHLSHPEKRCADCISKHFLTIEALAEECASLCKPDAVLGVAHEIAALARVLHHAVATSRVDPKTCVLAASILRRMRKELQKTFATLPVASLPSKEAAAVRTVLRRAASVTPRRRRAARRA